jgi:hypothetical protein
MRAQGTSARPCCQCRDSVQYAYPLIITAQTSPDVNTLEGSRTAGRRDPSRRALQLETLSPRVCR